MEGDDAQEAIRELYSNYFRVGFNSVEFLVEFGRQFEGIDERFYLRVITGPAHAKALLRLLEGSVSGYEERFGPIAEDLDS
jgi:hypothetical protein